MALMTGEQYIESIRRLNMEIYMFGKRIDSPVDDPILRPSLNSVRMTYDLAQMPEYQDLMTVISPDTGERINRFTHIHRSTDDLRNKVKMQRLLGQKTASCFQRCVGMDAFNAVFSTSFEVDRKYGTRYHENFREFMLYCQENDLTVDGAMTDPKGDRSKAPPRAGRPRPVPAGGGAPGGRHCGVRRQGPPDRHGEQPRGDRHAHPVHGPGGHGLRRVLRRAHRRQGHLHDRGPPVL